MPASFFRGFLQRYVRRLPSSFSMEIRGNLRCSFFKPARSCVSVGANAASEGKIRNDCSACRQVRQAFLLGPGGEKALSLSGGVSCRMPPFPAGRAAKPSWRKIGMLSQKDSNRKENVSACHSRQQRVRGAKTGREKSRRKVTACFQFPPIPPRALRKTYGKLPLFSIRG